MTARTTFRWKLGALALAVTASAPMSAAAQAWDYSASIYVWMSGIESSVDTPLGTVETELSFGDILEDLDFAFFGTFRATNGPWVVLGDLNYSALTSGRGSPFGVVFSARALAVSSSAMLGGVLAGWLGIRGLFGLGGLIVLASFWAFRRPPRGDSRPGFPAPGDPRGIAGG